MAADEVVNMEWDDNGEVERAEVVLETLETLFTRLDRHIELVTRQDESVPHVVEHLMQGALAVVDMLYAGREDTCVDTIGYYQNSWEIDEEPQPAPLDVWARGAVVAKASAPQPVTVKLSSGFGSRTTSLSGLPKKQADVEIEDTQSRQTDRSSNTRMSKTTKPLKPTSLTRQMTTRVKLSPEEQEREDRLREEISIRRRQKQITQQMLVNEEKARKDLAAMQASLKGKDYAYDHRGEVVIMTKIDPSRMPSLLTKPASAVRDPAEEEVVIDKQSGRGKDGGKGATGNMSTRSTKGAATTETTFIERPNEAQPAPTETVKPVMGVTLTMGRTTKRGAERKTASLTEMSREEYAYYIQESGHYQQLPKSAEFQRDQQQKLERQRAEFSSMQSARQETASMKRQQSLQRRVSNGPRPSTESSDGGPLGLGVPSKGLPTWMLDAEPAPKQTAKREPKKADVNKLLTSASDWGNSSSTIRRRDGGSERESSISPGKPRSRPSVEVRERTVGKVPRRPRDRQYGYITEQDLQEYQP